MTLVSTAFAIAPASGGTAEPVAASADQAIPAVPADQQKPEDNGVEPEPSEAIAEEQAKPAETSPEAEPESGMLGGIKHVTLTNRIGFGVVGTTMFAEYGVQAEIASKHFGVKMHWANWRPVDNDVSFSYSLGFGFHYYVFGDGPNGLYAGPAFQFTNISQNPDPMRLADTILRKRHVLENLAANPPAEGVRLPPADPTEFGMIINHRTGVGRQFNLLTPMVEVGYRHSWPERESPVYFTMGIELMLGYAVSDVSNYWDSGFTCTLNPQLGITW
jgi:hypothetical protein